MTTPKAAAFVGHDWFLFSGRLLLVALFAISGFQKLGQIDGISQALASKGLPLPLVAAWIGALVEIGAALAIILGVQARRAAVALILFTALATVLFHNYWSFEGAARDAQFIHFFKNVGLIGGLLLLIAAGPGRVAVPLRKNS